VTGPLASINLSCEGHLYQRQLQYPIQFDNNDGWLLMQNVDNDISDFKLICVDFLHIGER